MNLRRNVFLAMPLQIKANHLNSSESCADIADARRRCRRSLTVMNTLTVAKKLIIMITTTITTATKGTG